MGIPNTLELWYCGILSVLQDCAHQPYEVPTNSTAELPQNQGYLLCPHHNNTDLSMLGSKLGCPAYGNRHVQTLNPKPAVRGTYGVGFDASALLQFRRCIACTHPRACASVVIGFRAEGIFLCLEPYPKTKMEAHLD